MPRCVHDVQFMITMNYTSALRHNSDAPLLLLFVAVHGSLRTKIYASLLQKAVDECGFSMINVSNDGQVSHLGNILTLENL